MSCYVHVQLPDRFTPHSTRHLLHCGSRTLKTRTGRPPVSLGTKQHTCSATHHHCINPFVALIMRIFCYGNSSHLTPPAINFVDTFPQNRRVPRLHQKSCCIRAKSLAQRVETSPERFWLKNGRVRAVALYSSGADGGVGEHGSSVQQPGSIFQ